MCDYGAKVIRTIYKKSLKISNGVIRSRKSKKDRQHNTMQ